MNAGAVQVGELVEAIHQQQVKTVVVTTGGGSQAVAWLLNHTGASRSLLEVTIPYAQGTLADYLHQPVKQTVSAETAQAMAACAFDRAEEISRRAGPVIGLACTAALATTRARRGEERAFICSRTVHTQTTYRVRFHKGVSDRLQQEMILSRVMLNALAATCGLNQSLSIDWTGVAEITADRQPLEDALERLLAASLQAVRVLPDGQIISADGGETALFPGSFNPFHEGHEQLARVAAELLSRPITLELSVVNVDKSTLSRQELYRRIGGLQWRYRVVVTRAATFLEKARLFPGCWFIIGYDTAVRLLEPRYYGGPAAMQAALEEMGQLGCRFLVAGRVHQGVFQTLDHLSIPAEWTALFAGIPENRFRYDFSSSQIRATMRRVRPEQEGKKRG